MKTTFNGSLHSLQEPSLGKSPWLCLQCLQRAAVPWVLQPHCPHSLWSSGASGGCGHPGKSVQASLPDADHVASLESCMGCLAGDSAAQAQPAICTASSLCHKRCGRVCAKRQQGNLCVCSFLVVLLYSQYFFFIANNFSSAAATLRLYGLNWKPSCGLITD